MALAFGDERLIENVYSTPAATLTTLKDDGSVVSKSLIEFHFSLTRYRTPTNSPIVFLTRSIPFSADCWQQLANAN